MEVRIIKVKQNIVYFKISEVGVFNLQLIDNGDIIYESDIESIDSNMTYFVEHSSVSNYNTILRIGDSDTIIHNIPIINIMTRVSRFELFDRCYNSVIGQTYKNINHIVTYETEELGNKLRTKYGTDNINLCKVPRLKKLDGLYRSFNYNQYFKQDDLDAWDYAIWDKHEKTTNNLVGGVRSRTEHFPFESYLKMAEIKIQYGWVLYLDDDDLLLDDTVIEKLVSNLVKHDIDTIHWFPCYIPHLKGDTVNTEDGLFPQRYVLDHLGNGYPPAMNCINSTCFSFHSKYIEYTAWDQWYGDDYRTAASLAERIDKNNVIHTPIVCVMGR